METIVFASEEAVFEPFRSEIALPIPAFNRNLIVGAGLMVQTRLDCVPKHVASISSAGANDLRIYLNDHDITRYYLQELGGLVDALPPDTLARQYGAAMTAFLDYADSLGNLYDGLIAKERAKAVQLAATRPFSALLTQLGNTSHGHKGHLHLCNFLYGSITTIPEVSLTSVIAKYNLANPAQTIQTALIDSMLVSSGPSYTRAPVEWKAKKPYPQGAALATICLHYHDPLEERVAELEKEFKKMQSEITGALDKIRAELGSAGTIRKTLNTVQKKVEDSAQLAIATKNDLASHAAQITTMKGTLDHIKTIVDSL